MSGDAAKEATFRGALPSQLRHASAPLTLMSFLDIVWSTLGGRSSNAGIPSYANTGAKIWPLSAAAREDLKQGTVYNMKVVLRGARGVGKTTLLTRLCGHPLPTTYSPTREIWASTRRFLGAGCAPHKGTRVDIWDVVDEGSLAATSSSVRFPKELDLVLRQQLRRCVADARSIDVYQGCQCVIFVIDCTDSSSLEYALRESATVPYTASVVLALNKVDEPMHKHVVRMADIEAICESLPRSTSKMVMQLREDRLPPMQFSAPAACVSLSARTGYGIPAVLALLNTPNTLLRIAEMEERLAELYSTITGPGTALAVPPPSAGQPSSVPPPRSSPETASVSKRQHHGGSTEHSSAPFFTSDGSASATAYSKFTTTSSDDAEEDHQTIRPQLPSVKLTTPRATILFTEEAATDATALGEEARLKMLDDAVADGCCLGDFFEGTQTPSEAPTSPVSATMKGLTSVNDGGN